MRAVKYIKDLCDTLKQEVKGIEFRCQVVEPAPQLEKGQKYIASLRFNRQYSPNYPLLLVTDTWDFSKRDMIERIKKHIAKHSYTHYILRYRTAVRGGRGRLLLIAEVME